MNSFDFCLLMATVIVFVAVAGCFVKPEVFKF